MNQSGLLNAQYQDSIKHKEFQHDQITELRNNHLNIENQVRMAHLKFLEKDAQLTAQACKSHDQRRLAHLDECMQSIKQISESMNAVSRLEDVDQINGLIDHYSRKLELLEDDIYNKDRGI